MQKFSLSDVTYKTAEVLTIFNTQLFLSSCSFLNTLQATAQANNESVRKGCIPRFQCFVKCIPVEDLTGFAGQERQHSLKRDEVTAVRAALLSAVSQGVIVHDSRAHVCLGPLMKQVGCLAPLAHLLFIQLALVAVGSLLHPEACEMDYNQTVGTK